jgi:penicillin-binding protein 3
MMKKVFIGLTLLSLLFLLTSCKEDEVKPDERLQEYVQLWNDLKFNEMYEDYLTASSKDTYPKEEMVDRYEKLYSDLGIDQLEVSFTKPNEEEQDYEELEEISFPISVKMNSLAGEIAFDHEVTLVKETRNEKENWYVQWDPSFIFKELEPGDTVGIDTEAAPRGEIFDRNGVGLAINDKLTMIGIVPKDMEGHEDETKKALSEMLHLDVEYIDQQLNQAWVKPDLFVPLRTINPSDEELFQALMELPGVWPQDNFGRLYPLGESAAHLIGYIGEITAEELEEHEGEGYSQHDMIGKRGLEQLFEKELRGEPGATIYITKENGDKITIAEKQAKKGEDIHLTIDANVQQVIFKNMNGNKGTATAIHPATGETLALVSSPSFDPNGLTSNYYNKLLEDEDNPILNRFTALYAPGSTFKPIVASIGLANNIITPDLTRDIKGKEWGNGEAWGNYKVRRVTDPGHPVNLEDALVYSDNIYFAQTAVELENEGMVNGLKQFGFEEEFPFTYPFSPSTISNSGDLKNEILRADTGYGQGELQISLLHLATMYTPILNNGDLVKPKLLQQEETEIWHEDLITDEHANILQKALRNVVASPNGTARGANIEGIAIAGKTGTAELKSTQGEQGKENGVFVAYEANKKDMIIAMLLEGVEEDGSSSYVVERVTEVFKELY